MGNSQASSFSSMSGMSGSPALRSGAAPPPYPQPPAPSDGAKLLELVQSSTALLPELATIIADYVPNFTDACVPRLIECLKQIPRAPPAAATKRPAYRRTTSYQFEWFVWPKWSAAPEHIRQLRLSRYREDFERSLLIAERDAPPAPQRQVINAGAHPLLAGVPASWVFDSKAQPALGMVIIDCTAFLNAIRRLSRTHDWNRTQAATCVALFELMFQLAAENNTPLTASATTSAQAGTAGDELYFVECLTNSSLPIVHLSFKTIENAFE